MGLKRVEQNPRSTAPDKCIARVDTLDRIFTHTHTQTPDASIFYQHLILDDNIITPPIAIVRLTGQTQFLSESSKTSIQVSLKSFARQRKKK